MKIMLIIVLTLLFSLMFVSGELRVPCSETKDCSVFLDGSYSCVQRTCIKPVISSVPKFSGSFISQTKVLTWNLFIVEENSISSGCLGQGCLEFAPVVEKTSMQKMLDFVLYVKV